MSYIRSHFGYRNYGQDIDLSNEAILIRSIYVIINNNLESDLKLNISKLIPNDTENKLSLENRLFLKIIVNLQFFILANSLPLNSYSVDYTGWLLTSYVYDDVYIYNLLSILFHKKTYNIINTFVSLIKNGRYGYRSGYGLPTSLYDDYKGYFELQDPLLDKKKHILEDITVKDDSPDAKLYMLSFLDFPKLNDIKTKTISDFIDAFISLNDNFHIFQSKPQKNIDEFLFKLLIEIYENYDFRIKMTEHNTLEDKIKKEEKMSEINSLVYKLIKGKQIHIIKYEIDYKIEKLNYFINKFNYIQNILKNIDNPFPLMINELKKMPDMAGYIQYIYHILYKIKESINHEINAFMQFIEIPFEKVPDSIMNRIKHEELILIQNNPKYKDLFNRDNNIELLLKPTKEIIQYYLNFLERIHEIIPIFINEKIFPFRCIEGVDLYINKCNEYRLTHPTDLPEFQSLAEFDSKYDSPERIEAREQAEAERREKPYYGYAAAAAPPAY
jgi:hypothetical protein